MSRGAGLQKAMQNLNDSCGMVAYSQLERSVHAAYSELKLQVLCSVSFLCDHAMHAPLPQDRSHHIRGAISLVKGTNKAV